MNKINVLAIAPYEGMKDTMVNVAEKFDEINLTAYTGNLQEGVDILLSEDLSNYDVVLSRGGTALAINKHSSIPVFEVSLSHYDILSAIKLAQQCNEKFAVIGFPSISNFARMLCNVLQYDVKIITINSIEESYDRINELHDEGIKLIVGDVINSEYAKSVGCNSILLTSGASSIKETFKKMIQSFSFYANIKEMSEINKSYFDNTCEGLNIVTKDGEVIYSYGLGEQQDIKEYICHRVSKLKKQNNQTIIKSISNSCYSFNFWQEKHKSELCYFCNIKKINKSPYTKASGIRTINANDVSHEDLNFYYNNNNFSKSLNKLTLSDRSIAIIGEKGTGKDFIASIIYRNSKYNKNPLYIIDCDLLDTKGFKYLLKDEDSPLYFNDITICIKNFVSLEDTMAHKLISFISDSGCSKRNILMFLYDLGYEETLIDEEFTDLINQFNCMCINIDPLRHRISEIQSIASLCINDINNTKGTQLVGIEPAAISLLEGYRWPYNIDQLKRVLVEAATRSSLGPYVSFETVFDIISKEKELTKSIERASTTFNITGTLDEITHNIVMSVLSDENSNQTKAAERLGISRTTLWRIVNKNK